MCGVRVLGFGMQDEGQVRNRCPRFSYVKTCGARILGFGVKDEGQVRV